MNIIWAVVSNILHFHPYLGRWSNLTIIFHMGWNHQLEIIFWYFFFPGFAMNWFLLFYITRKHVEQTIMFFVLVLGWYLNTVTPQKRHAEQTLLFFGTSNSCLSLFPTKHLCGTSAIMCYLFWNQVVWDEITLLIFGLYFLKTTWRGNPGTPTFGDQMVTNWVAWRPFFWDWTLRIPKDPPMEGRMNMYSPIWLRLEGAYTDPCLECEDKGSAWIGDFGCKDKGAKTTVLLCCKIRFAAFFGLDGKRVCLRKTETFPVNAITPMK